MTCLGACRVYFGILEDQEKIHTVMKTYPYPGLPGSPRPALISASLQSFSSRSNWSVLATRSSCKNRVARAGLKSIHACSVWVTTKSLSARLPSVVLVKLLTRDDVFPNFSSVGWVAILSEVALQHPSKLVGCINSTHNAGRAAGIPAGCSNSVPHPACATIGQCQAIT